MHLAMRSPRLASLLHAHERNERKTDFADRGFGLVDAEVRGDAHFGYEVEVFLVAGVELASVQRGERGCWRREG